MFFGKAARPPPHGEGPLDPTLDAETLGPD
jgi:hypothetical protein